MKYLYNVIPNVLRHRKNSGLVSLCKNKCVNNALSVALAIFFIRQLFH